MNKKRILILAKLLEKAAKPKSKPKLGFNMGTFKGPGCDADKTGHNCNTVACIGGWAQAAFAPKSRGDVERVAAKVLDLHLDTEAHSLFYPSILSGLHGWSGDITPKQAAKVLRHLAKTGDVDWGIIKVKI